MTVHVPSGLLLQAPVDDPFVLSATAGPVLVALATDRWYALLGEQVAAELDCMRAGVRTYLDPDPGGVLAAVARHWAQDVSDEDSPAAVDFECTVHVLAHPERIDAKLAVLYAANPVFRDALLRLPGASEYEFSESGSQPSHVCTAEWDRRKQVWTAAYGPGASQSAGWSWTPLEPAHLRAQLPALSAPDPAQVLAHLPSDEQRAHRLAKAITVLSPQLRALAHSSMTRYLVDLTEQALPTARAAIAPIALSDLRV